LHPYWIQDFKKSNNSSITITRTNCHQSELKRTQKLL
jgi:hypothetical protein